MGLRAVIVSAVEESKKKTKKEVNYSTGMRKSRCGLCEYFIPDSRAVAQQSAERVNKSNGTCEKVKGRINAEMWCKLFKSKY